jgi:hypothetical protein
MPNWKLSDKAMDVAKARLNNLCTHHNNIMESGFPLTQTEIANAVATTEIRELLNKLIALKVTSVRKSSVIAAVITDTQIERGAVVNIAVNPSVFFSFDAQARFWHSWSDAYRVREQLAFDLDTLNENTRKRLVTWVNQAVRERRRTALTQTVVTEFLNEHVGSTYHLKARWPAMTLLFHESSKYDAKWEQRLRETPGARLLRRWGWDSNIYLSANMEWYEKNKRAMQVAEKMLLGAALVRAEVATTTVSASIGNWQRINGEKF